MPDYQFMRWDESNFEYNQYEASKYAYEVKQYSLVSDVCRYNVLAKYGGIYLDTDVEVFQRFDRFLACNFFSGIELYLEFEKEHIADKFLNEDGTPHETGIDIPHMEILTSLMACNKGNEMICQIRDYYNTVKVDKDKAIHFRNWVNNDRLVARYLTDYGFKYKNETQYLENNYIVYGTGVFGHAFCVDDRYEVSYHHNAFTWGSESWSRSKKMRYYFDKLGLLSVYNVVKSLKNRIR